LKDFKKMHNFGANDAHDRAVEEEFFLLNSQVLHELKHQIPFKDFWLIPSLRKRCIVGWLTLAAAQGTGTLVINSKTSIPCDYYPDHRFQIMGHYYTPNWAIPQCNS
jgi:hypothetical protein